MKPFSAFVRSHHFDRWQGDGADGAEFRSRLSRAKIASLCELQTWTRERYPNFYKRRSIFLDGRTGKEVIGDIWADYLRWAECPA
ncbi:hypothetical protein [Edaphosphingomonas haloaromaticamans]|uniref:Uncharacterized protein n=1 Tax=Edaphosphingomonas haloaromaticamans TaxID=653954 RepID=A0A1S1HBQ0_9SPHN|nr:hypothetical protein [Sphingomonas haloaromaticamans]OHT19056.1 hypothetical protein BHE75_01038 [Sphingomonas haloaromaticamans]